MSQVSDGRVEVAITPTYSGCPAMNMIALEIELALERAGIRAADSPDRAVAGLDHGLDERGRPAQAAGIRHRAAAGRQASRRALFGEQQVACPQCGSQNTEAAVRVRLDLLQGAVALQGLPRAVRLFQVSLTMSHAPRSIALPSTISAAKSPDAVSMTFAIPKELADDYSFNPGQYLTLRTTMDGEEVRRSYSICSGPDDGELRIAVKKVDGGAFSNWAADELKTGDELDVMTPTGRFGIAHAPDDGADLCRLCRGIRHHADPVDRQGRAGARAEQPLLPVLRQPLDVIA